MQKIPQDSSTKGPAEMFTRIRDGSSPLAMTSKYTSPVNISAGPLAELPWGIFHDHP